MLAFRSYLGFLIFVSVILGVCFGARPALAQGPPGAMMAPPEEMNFGVSQMGALARNQKEWAVAGRVMTMSGNFIRGAHVLVSPLQADDRRVLESGASGDFQTVYFLTELYVTDFEVWLTVKKEGFETAHELIHYADFPNPVWLPITLRTEGQDPTLLPRQELISHLVPELQSLGPSDGLLAKSEKEYAKGVREFVGKGRPDLSLDDFYDVARRNPNCAKCRTMLALAELDSGNWDGAARNAESAAQWTLKNTAGGSPEALELAGVMESWLHNPKAATYFLVDAHKLKPSDPLVLQEIGRAQFELGRFEVADTYLSKSIAAGAGPEARLLKVQALLGEGSLDKANAEMRRFLNGRKVETMPIEVRRVWAELQNGKQIRALYAESGKRKVRTAASFDYLHYTARQLKGLVPAKDQSRLKPILAAVGENVAALFRNFQNTISVEQIRQEQLRRNGKISASRSGKYRYLCLVPSHHSILGFTEYRQNVERGGGLPRGLDRGYMLTSGFASAALVLHPAFQSQSKFRYLGRQVVDGHETYVIAFAQEPMKARLMGAFDFGNHRALIFEQGLAWVNTRNDEIVRLRTDLLKPLPEVRLREETTQIDYHDVRFKKLARAFPLPETVVVTVHWNGKRLRNVHRYSDFKLYNVGLSEKIKVPKTQNAASKAVTDSSNPPVGSKVAQP